jgi:hypothetical protein
MSLGFADAGGKSIFLPLDTGSVKMKPASGALLGIPAICLAKSTKLLYPLDLSSARARGLKLSRTPECQYERHFNKIKPGTKRF